MRGLTNYRACETCAKLGKKCYKSTSARRTACRRCADQKGRCSWAGGRSRSQPRRPALKVHFEDPPESSTTEAIGQIFREIVQIRAELSHVHRDIALLKTGDAKIRAELSHVRKDLAFLKTGDARILGRVSTTNLDVGEVLTLLHSVDVNDEGAGEDEAERDEDKTDDAAMDVEQ